MMKNWFGKSKLPFKKPLKTALLIVGLASLLSACANSNEYGIRSPNGQNVIKFTNINKRPVVKNFSGPAVKDPQKTISLADYAGKIVVLNVWGQWCAPCRVEIPELEKIFIEYKDKNVSLLGINVKDDQAMARDYLLNNQVKYASIFDPGGKTLSALHGVPTSTIPTTVILDKQYRVAVVFIRSVTAPDLRPVLDELIKE